VGRKLSVQSQDATCRVSWSITLGKSNLYRSIAERTTPTIGALCAVPGSPRDGREAVPIEKLDWPPPSFQTSPARGLAHNISCVTGQKQAKVAGLFGLFMLYNIQSTFSSNLMDYAGLLNLEILALFGAVAATRYICDLGHDCGLWQKHCLPLEDDTSGVRRPRHTVYGES
jgi:hypothetical protein